MVENGPGLLARHLRLPRQGASLEECQDALAIGLERGRFAVADGASESTHAGLWAQLLVDAFVDSNTSGVAWADGLKPVQQSWKQAVTPAADSPALPWYLEVGLRQGAFATFLGLEVRPGDYGRWHWEAVAVGDSCLFQTRGDTLVQVFPVERASDFNNTPWLVSSRAAPRQREVRSGEARGGDCFWLMTDALAQWFLTQVERGIFPWQTAHGQLNGLTTNPPGSDWIGELRRTQQLRNDDVTLLAVSLDHES
jgi:hypothetical protein